SAISTPALHVALPILLIIQQLLADNRFEVGGWRISILRNHHQLLQVARGHEKTDQLAVTPMRHVYTGDVAIDSDIGTATHPWVEGAGKHQMVREAAPADTVVGPF